MRRRIRLDPRWPPFLRALAEATGNIEVSRQPAGVVMSPNRSSDA